jgi:hypothetical protein
MKWRAFSHMPQWVRLSEWLGLAVVARARVCAGIICTGTIVVNNAHLTLLLEVEVPRSAKTWADKRRAKPPHTVTLDKDFAGVAAGSRLLISCPLELEEYLRKHVPAGTTKEIQQVRRELASLHDADATCPVSTSIFLRTVSEAAWDELNSGKAITEVAPFWRVVDPKSPLAKKLRAGSQWIEQQRLAEATGDRDSQ